MSDLWWLDVSDQLSRRMQEVARHPRPKIRGTQQAKERAIWYKIQLFGGLAQIKFGSGPAWLAPMPFGFVTRAVRSTVVEAAPESLVIGQAQSGSCRCRMNTFAIAQKSTLARRAAASICTEIASLIVSNT